MVERADWVPGAEYGVSLLKEAGNISEEIAVNRRSLPFSLLTPVEANEQQKQRATAILSKYLGRGREVAADYEQVRGL